MPFQPSRRLGGLGRHPDDIQLDAHADDRRETARRRGMESTGSVKIETGIHMAGVGEARGVNLARRALGDESGDSLRPTSPFGRVSKVKRIGSTLEVWTGGTRSPLATRKPYRSVDGLAHGGDPSPTHQDRRASLGVVARVESVSSSPEVRPSGDQGRLSGSCTFARLRRRSSRCTTSSSR